MTKSGTIYATRRRNQWGEYSLKDYSPVDVFMEEEKEPVLCKRFGCGRILTHHERLFGDYCPEHSKNKSIDVTNFINY